jgi:hypothetical protein
MTTTDRPALPRQWTRTLPWLAGLLLGTSAHLVWWTSTQTPAEPAVRVVAMLQPDVHVHVHSTRAAPEARVSRTTGRRQAPRAVPRQPLNGARGAVVCNPQECTIRRSFIERLLHEPSLVVTLHQGGLLQTVRYRVIDG